MEININEDISDSLSDIYPLNFKVRQWYVFNDEPWVLKKVKIVLPDKQVAYLKEFPYNQSILIAYSNEQFSEYIFSRLIM